MNVEKIRKEAGRGREAYSASRKAAFKARHLPKAPKKLMVNGEAKSG